MRILRTVHLSGLLGAQHRREDPNARLSVRPGLTGWAQVNGGGPSNRNLSNLFIEGGMNWLAPFTERPDDTFGLAVSYLGISPAAQAYSRDLVSFGRATSAYAGNETVLEATYLATITNWLTLQPDLQFVFNPGAGIPNAFGSRPLPNALVIGMRATFRL